MNSCLHIFNYTCISDIIYIKLLYTNIIFALRIMSGIVFLIRIYNCFQVCCAIFTSFVLHVQILHLPGKPFSWSCVSCTKYLWSVQVFVLLLNNFVHKIPSYAFESFDWKVCERWWVCLFTVSVYYGMQINLKTLHEQ